MCLTGLISRSRVMVTVTYETSLRVRRGATATADSGTMYEDVPQPLFRTRIPVPRPRQKLRDKEAVSARTWLYILHPIQPDT